MKKSRLFLLGLVGITMAGCSATGQSKSAVASANSSSTKSPVGRIISTEKANPDISYKMANKHVKFYRSLKEFGTKSGVYSSYATAKTLTFGPIEKYTTTKGIYYHMVNYSYGAYGFDHPSLPDMSKDYMEFAENGYVKSTDLKRYHPIKKAWTYKHRKPYYVGNTWSHRLWNAPVATMHYAYVMRGFDRLAMQQLYATKEEVKRSNGAHYVYLETAKGRKLGWVAKSPKTLIAGYYRDPGSQFLTVQPGQTMRKHVQSKKSTHNRVGINDSLSLQQRAYVVKSQYQVSKVLVMGMDNRPTKIYFSNGHATKVKFYEYWRKPWKTVTKPKKLRTHFSVWHEFAEGVPTRVSFFSSKSPKLTAVKTEGSDGSATTTIYRSGKVAFKTHPYKHVVTYPLSDFK
ncbi:hypothetical protein [Levilactobacillus cerevisiae]|uniref:hypothetical protein n=1 Tax=Levilactobacillus cerevisiae TaxID=1704076 RepID=UPI000F7A602C|nr:hypothetical protein [Levilactobacillus cerevisiae]